MANQKSFLSRAVAFAKKGIKKGCRSLLGKLVGKASYRFFGFARGLAREGKITYQKHILYPETTFIRNTPHTLEKKIFWKFKISRKVSFPEEGVLVVPNGVATKQGGNLSSTGRLIPTFLDNIEGRKPHEHALFHFSTSSFFPKIKKINARVITLAAGWQGAFYHWMFEVLPRLHLVEKAGLEGSYIFADQSFAFQKESLAALKFTKEQILEEIDAVQAQTLIIPSVPKIAPRSWACDYLREKFLPLVKREKKRRRIYLSRADAGKRRVTNEEELLPILEKEGYEKVILTRLSFLEQIALFASADKIIAPHGAGLSHLVFCPSSAQVLEFFSPAYVNLSYWALCDKVGHHYTYLFDEGERYPDGVNSSLDPDLVINPKKLLKALEIAHATPRR